MINKLTIAVAILFTSLTAQSFNDAYRLPITRDGVTKTKLAYNFWSGEYPGPIPHVTKKTTVKAYKSLRKLNQPVSCTLKAGIYHPWSTTGNSVINYYTITGVNTYVATTDFTSNDAFYSTGNGESIDFMTGDIITNTVYGSEGWCGATLIRNTEKNDIEYFCDLVDEPTFVQTQEDSSPDEQWLYLKCTDGSKAFIQDSAFMSSPNVKSGTILGYGDVGPQ